MTLPFILVFEVKGHLQVNSGIGIRMVIPNLVGFALKMAFLSLYDLNFQGQCLAMVPIDRAYPKIYRCNTHTFPWSKNILSKTISLPNLPVCVPVPAPKMSNECYGWQGEVKSWHSHLQRKAISTATHQGTAVQAVVSYDLITV